MTDGPSKSVREHVLKLIASARREQRKQLTVLAGDIHTALGFRNRVPVVCNVLRSRELLNTGRVRIVGDVGPPSGLSTTVAITYEMLDDPSDRDPAPRSGGSRLDAFLQLRGIARDAFKALGGGEASIRRDRDRFYGEGRE